MLVAVAIDCEERNDFGPFLADSVLLAHSEILQPGVKFSALSVYFQYVKITPLYETFIIIINHAEMAQFYKQGKIVAHVEPTQEIAHVNMIQRDPLLHAIYLCMEGQQEPSIDHGESRICLDTEQFSFDPVDIKCVSSDHGSQHCIINIKIFSIQRSFNWVVMVVGFTFWYCPKQP